MPNWVFNNLHVEGDPKLIAEFKARAGKMVTDFDGTKERALSFLNFISPSPEVDYENNWYDWRVENWGTKWEATDCELTDDDKNFLGYKFDTAWSQPQEFFELVTSQYPKLEFYCVWEEEQGWGGEAVGSSGVFAVTKQWSIPETHAEYVALDKQFSCNCAFTDEPEIWFDDCPREES
jgi:hypothetical protein